ncbi:hypothetical protein [Xylanimonas allomyrinae]|uniref:hypothetical protein n=1 Tax=Xylanimonas allomyrinae TaxID=2509459 RepID=UPI001B87CF37|nr:hypothetical protein [Xylanimonas allomyrinae]
MLPPAGVGRHRRLRLSDVPEFRDRRRVARRLGLEEMTRQAGEDDLSGQSAGDYADALDRARHRG